VPVCSWRPADAPSLHARLPFGVRYALAVRPQQEVPSVQDRCVLGSLIWPQQQRRQHAMFAADRAWCKLQGAAQCARLMRARQLDEAPAAAAAATGRHVCSGQGLVSRHSQNCPVCKTDVCLAACAAAAVQRLACSDRRGCPVVGFGQHSQTLFRDCVQACTGCE
jgi:hypothetical protein